MKFKRTDSEKRKVRATVDLTPLIDVVFQLLIFFMLTTTFVVQTSVQVQMPEAEGTANLENKDVTITMTLGEGGPDGKGPVYFNDEEIETWQELSERLVQARETQPDLIMLIRCDARADHGRFVRVVGIATSLGISRFGIAAEPLREES